MSWKCWLLTTSLVVGVLGGMLWFRSCEQAGWDKEQAALAKKVVDLEATAAQQADESTKNRKALDEAKANTVAITEDFAAARKQWKRSQRKPKVEQTACDRALDTCVRAFDFEKATRVAAEAVVRSTENELETCHGLCDLKDKQVGLYKKQSKKQKRKGFGIGYGAGVGTTLVAVGVAALVVR